MRKKVSKKERQSLLVHLIFHRLLCSEKSSHARTIYRRHTGTRAQVRAYIICVCPLSTDAHGKSMALPPVRCLKYLGQNVNLASEAQFLHYLLNYQETKVVIIEI